MALTKKQAWLIGSAVILIAAGLALPRTLPVYQHWKEDKRWETWMDDNFAFNTALHANHWDELNKPLEQGGLAPLSWGHFTTGKVPRQSFRLRAWFKVTQPTRPAWLKLIAASPVEYYNLTGTGSTTDRPRSRYAGFFSRLDQSVGRALLSVGQEDRSGTSVNVASAAAQEPPLPQCLQMTFEDDRLVLQWGDQKAETLARELFIGQTPDIQFGLSGENMIVTRLQVLTRKDPGNLKAEAEADGYALVGKAHMAEPIYRDLALAEKDPAARARYELRQARSLFLETHRDDAVALLKTLIERDPQGFYAGYARLDLAKVLQEKGASSDELGEVLKGLYAGQTQHPAAGAARLMHARILAQSPSSLPQAQRLAMDALKAGDPSVQTQALDFLSQGPTAVSPVDLLTELRSAGKAPGASPVLADALALRQAQSQADANDLAGLAMTCLESQGLPLDTRFKNYALLTDTLAKAKPALNAEALWQALALKSPQGDYMLRDMLAIMGFNHYWAPGKRPDIAAPLFVIADLLGTHVQQREAGKPAAAERGFVDLAQRPLPSSYGYLPQDQTSVNGNETCLIFKSGTYWGCGVSFEGTQAPRLEGGSIDLSGYKFLQAELWAPKDCEVFLSISESGVADPKSDKFAGEKGADGEQYLFAGFTGKGEWQPLKLPLDQVYPALNWGNPRGNLTLDLQAIKKIDMAIPGNQGVGRACLRNLRFTVE